MEDRKRSNTILIGLSLSVVVSVLAAIIWIRFSSNATELTSVSEFFAAVSASIATIWLAVAVFIQSAELRLQRKELAAQREQTRLLTEEAKAQAESQGASLSLQTKRDLYAQVESIINSNAEVFRNVAHRLRQIAIDEVDRSRTAQILSGTGGSVGFKRKCVLVTLYQDGGGETKTQVAWEAVLDHSIVDSDAWGAILSCAAEAVVADAAMWWRDNLAMSVPAHGRVSSEDVQAGLLAAIYRVDASLIDADT